VKRVGLLAWIAVVCAACAPTTAQLVVTGTVEQPTITPIVLPSISAISDLPTQTKVVPTQTAVVPSATVVIPSVTRAVTATPTHTPTIVLTRTPDPQITPTDTATTRPSPTVTATIAPPPAMTISSASTSANVGWSCGDFPCQTEIDEWLKRIQVPDGFAVSFVGQFPGQVNQIAYAPDGALVATVLENGTRTGAVWRLATDGSLARVTPTLESPFGLAFRPNTNDLYITGRTTPLQGGSLWRLNADGTFDTLFDDLPCCYSEVDNQPNGLMFGEDGFLYMGIGSLTDHGESANPQVQAWANVLPYEAAIVRVNVDTLTLETFADGIRNPIDITRDSGGQFYATDSGVVTGLGDRILTIDKGVNYGFPYYRGRGCEVCPPSRGNNFAPPDLLALPPYTLPRGLTVYKGNQFPINMRDTLFVTLWNAPYQQVIWFNPRDPALQTQTPETPFVPVSFMTGLLRPSDVIVDRDGALVVSDWIYGHVWSVTFTGEFATATPFPTLDGFVLPTPVVTTQPLPTTAPSGFATNTPSP
jgi:glucose/arabinose dehydrogenase